ncbi:MAG: DUF362 domain-containing protein [Candidatus Eisenbacteria bacterium]
MKRRRFLKAGGAAFAASLLPWSLSLGDDKPAAVVWEIEGAARDAVRSLFSSLGGIKKLLSGDPSKATVLIKPNLCLPHPPGRATTTSPELVDALCEFFVDAGVRDIIITDHTLQQAANFSRVELVKVAEKYPAAKLVLANERSFFEPVDVAGKVLKKTEILKMLSSADLFINVATAKHHSAARVSLAIKNLMGAIWDRSAFHTQLDLAKAIGDLATVVRPDLNIIDARRVLLNGGPTGPGPVTEDNRLFAGTDILALDSVVTSRYKFGGRSLSAREVPHLMAAYDNGVGEIDLKRIKVEVPKTDKPAVNATGASKG